MIEKLRMLLLDKYNYKLESYKVCQEDIHKNKMIIPFFILFLVVAVLFFTTEFIDFIILGFSFFALIIVPLALKKKESYEVVVVTPEYLIKQTSKKDVVAIKFDNIIKYGTDKTGVVIKDEKDTISLHPSDLEEDILTIIDILEAKGKTFNRSKDYMIRPIKIGIIDNEITIIDIDSKETLTEKIVKQYSDEYPMLTPGFVKAIVLMNSIVEDAYSEGNNLFIKLGRFEVNAGHPENILFESRIALDCILIFENATISSIVKKEASGTDEEILEASLETLVANIEKGVISNWKYLKNEIDIQFSVGLFIINASIEYNEVIVGWKKFN